MKVEINLIFLIKLYFLYSQKVKTKFRYLENEKSFQDEIKKKIIIFKGLSVTQTKNFFLEGESPTLIYLGYGKTKHWIMFSMRKRRKSKHKFGRTKVCMAKEVRKYFVNSKIENVVFN